MFRAKDILSRRDTMYKVQRSLLRDDASVQHSAGFPRHGSVLPRTDGDSSGQAVNAGWHGCMVDRRCYLAGNELFTT